MHRLSLLAWIWCLHNRYLSCTPSEYLTQPSRTLIADMDIYCQSQPTANHNPLMRMQPTLLLMVWLIKRKTNEQETNQQQHLAVKSSKQRQTGCPLPCQTLHWSVLCHFQSDDHDWNQIDKENSQTTHWMPRSPWLASGATIRGRQAHVSYLNPVFIFECDY